MNFFGNFNMFMNNGLNFTPFSSYSFNNFSFFNFPSFNFSGFGNVSGAGNFNNNISIFNNFSNSAFNNCWNSFSFGDTFTYSASATRATTGSSSSSGMGRNVLTKAQSYIGRVNSDKEGNALFSPKNYAQTSWYKEKGRWGWCVDFATYCAASELGNKYPAAMKTSSPSKLRSAAVDNKCWVNGWNSSVAKPGDIILFPGKGDSGLHVAILESINSDGTITTVDGNASNRVKRCTRSTSSVKGFVSIEKLA